MRSARWLVVLAAVLAAWMTENTALAAVGQRPNRCGVPFPGHAPAPWPSMRRNQHNTGLGTIPAVYHGDRPWSFRTGAGLFITPVVAGNGMIYFGSADHNFYALTPRGKLCWKLRTGNIIDAAAALDPAQRTVTIGSGDDYLYHLSTNPAARRRVVWRFRATSKPVTGQLVDWWEDDIAFGPGRDIFTGNTGGLVYSFTPTGRLRWTFTASNSVWTMPAFGAHGTTFWGSVDRNIYALDSHGSKIWSTPTLGFVISSPAIGSSGTVYMGSFDSKLYALNPATGTPEWTFDTNDNIYSSPALGRNSKGETTAIYFASTDGSVYALTPGGKLMWSYDTGEPIRSSPVLGPGPPGDHHDVLYVGSSDGSLYALDANSGRRRWSFNTIDYRTPILRDRHELNSSPALGRTGVYIGSEDGHLWYVPYDYCLHHADSRCNTDPGTPYPPNVTRVLPVSSGGTTIRSGSEARLPTSSEITGRLIVRRAGSGAVPLLQQQGRTVYAAMLPARSAAALVHTRPAFSFNAQLSGDGRFVFLTPRSFLKPSTTYHVSVAGRWGADGVRVANYTTPGTWTRYGSFGDTFSFRTAPLGGSLPLKVTRNSVSVFRLRRLAVPLPSFLTSVNQIGFDSYVLLVGAVSVGPPDPSGRGRILLWATQARRGPGGTYVPDPHGTLVFPLAGFYRGSTLMLSVRGATLTFSFGKVPLQLLDMDFALGHSLHNEPGASIYAQAVCAQIPNYGPAAYLTGLCNTGGILPAEGTFITDPYHFNPAPSGHLSPPNARPRGVRVKSVVLQRPGAANGSVTVHLALARGVRYPAAVHRLGMLLVDQSGQPVGIDYTATTTFKNRAGSITGVRLTIPRRTRMPTHLTAYVMADVFPLATAHLY